MLRDILMVVRVYSSAVILLFIFLSSVSNAESNKDTLNPGSARDYITDNCLEVKDTVSNELDLRNNSLRRCKDGTVSFIQPSSQGVFNNEGRCGQTAASNLLYSYCHLAAHPESYSNYFLGDVTPGVRPKTMLDGINKIFENNRSHCPTGKWISVKSKNSDAFLDSIESGLTPKSSFKNLTRRTREGGEEILRSPVLALVRNPGGRIPHWLTIVDLLDRNNSSCTVVVNQWDDQFKIPCSVFVRWSYGIWDTYAPFLPGYLILRYQF